MCSACRLIWKFPKRSHRAEQSFCLIGGCFHICTFYSALIECKESDAKCRQQPQDAIHAINGEGDEGRLMERLSLMERLGQGIREHSCMPAKDRITCHNSLLSLGTKFCNYCWTTVPPCQLTVPKAAPYLKAWWDTGGLCTCSPSCSWCFSLLWLWGMCDWPQPISSALPQGVTRAQHWVLEVTDALEGMRGC